MKQRFKFFAFFLSFLMIQASAGFADVATVKGSAEDLYFASPSTVHSYKKSFDLHNLSAGALALSELEFVRMIDGLLSLMVKGRYHPLGGVFDLVEKGYEQLPQVKPVRRVGQLGEALQIRQISFSDVRVLGNAVSNGQTNGTITPLMQVRAQKIIILAEDLINDVDQVVMYPVNKTVGYLTGHETRIETLNYVGKTLGVVRRGFFAGLGQVNKAIVKSASKVLFLTEDVMSAYKRRKLSRQGAEDRVYLQMPPEIFEMHREYFKKVGKDAFSADLEQWKHLLSEQDIQTLTIIQPSSEFSEVQNSIRDLEAPVIVMIAMRAWKKPPQELYPFVITRDEFTAIVRS